MSTPAQQPQPVRPSLLRDILVQAVGSALGVGMVGLAAIAFGLVQVPQVQTVLGMVLSLPGVVGVSMLTAAQAKRATDHPASSYRWLHRWGVRLTLFTVGAFALVFFLALVWRLSEMV